MRTERLDLLALPPHARREVLRDILDVVNEHFPDLDVDTLWSYYAGEHLHTSRACCLFDDQDRLRGFQILCSQDVDLPGQRCVVLRSGVAKRRDLSTPGAFDRFGPVEMVRQALAAHRRRRTPWLVATSETPVTYHRLEPLIPGLLPRSSGDRPRDEQAREQLRALARAVGMSLEPERAWVVGGSGIQVSDDEREGWARRQDRTVQRFLRECPDYGHGKALLIGTPLGLGRLATLPLAAAGLL